MSRPLTIALAVALLVNATITLAGLWLVDRRAGDRMDHFRSYIEDHFYQDLIRQRKMIADLQDRAAHEDGERAGTSSSLPPITPPNPR